MKRNGIIPGKTDRFLVFIIHTPFIGILLLQIFAVLVKIRLITYTKYTGKIAHLSLKTEII